MPTRGTRFPGSTLRNGTVEAFDAGVVIRRGGGSTVERVLAQDNVHLGGGSELGDGILILSSSDNRVQEQRRSAKWSLQRRQHRLRDGR
jgi:hypothetical protein